MVSIDLLVNQIQSYPDYPSYEFQEIFVNDIILPTSKYPPSISWLSKLLKKIEKDIINKDIEMSDNFAELIINVLISKVVSIGNVDNKIELDDDSPFQIIEKDHLAYIKYHICNNYKDIQSNDNQKEDDKLDNENIVTLKTILNHNQVGLKVWDAAFYMTELLIRNSEGMFIKNTPALELGSGTGITSLILSSGGLNNKNLPNKIYMTDFHDNVIELLNENTTINNQNWNNNECNVEIKKLDWRDQEDIIEVSNYNPSFVYAADCTYAPDLCEPLMNTFEKILCKPRIIDIENEDEKFTSMENFLLNRSIKYKDKSTEVIKPFGLIAATQRNMETFEVFISSLNSKSDVLEYHDVTQWANDNIGVQSYVYNYRDIIKTICLIPINKNSK
jgi:hypothetical protein